MTYSLNVAGGQAYQVAFEAEAIASPGGGPASCTAQICDGDTGSCGQNFALTDAYEQYTTTMTAASGQTVLTAVITFTCTQPAYIGVDLVGVTYQGFAMPSGVPALRRYTYKSLT